MLVLEEIKVFWPLWNACIHRACGSRSVNSIALCSAVAVCVRNATMRLVYFMLIVPVIFDQSECCVCGQMRCIRNSMVFVQALVSCCLRARFACQLSGESLTNLFRPHAKKSHEPAHRLRHRSPLINNAMLHTTTLLVQLSNQEETKICTSLQKKLLKQHSG